MTENNTPTPAGAIFGVTAEDLSAHRAQLEADRAEAYQLWLTLPSGADEEAGRILTQRRALVEAWDNMSDAERAEVIADARTAPEVEAEPTEAMRLTEEAQKLVSDRATDRELADYISRVTTALIASELGNEQKAEAMSNAEATIRQQGEQIRTLNNAQISGDDYRLTDFWQTAGELAERAGYCDQYDRLCEELGGVPRSRDYTVSHAITVSVSVMAYSHQTAGADPSSDDFSDWTDYNSESELADAIREAVRAGDFTIEEEEVQEWEAD